jgi:flagellar motor protein MotB
MHLLKSKTKIVAGFALVLIGAAVFRTALHAQGEAGQTSPDATSKTSPAQPVVPVALPKGKKLILNDGTFQIAREYTVEGDRVRYWSVERSQWEEIPASLVNWDATHKAEADQAAEDAKLKAKIHSSEVAMRTQDIDVDRSLEIKPGLFLPDAVGFYVLETRQLYEMKQSLAATKLSMGRETERILSGVPLIPEKATMEIADAHAALRITVNQPEFFIRPADDREPHFRLLRAQIKNGHRVLDNINIHISGEKTHHSTDLDFQTWTPAHGVFRYTVNQRLEPGEYAFVEMTDDGINSYVWDFGIDAPSTNSKK